MNRAQQLLALLEEEAPEATPQYANNTVFVYQTLMNKKTRRDLLQREVEYEVDYIADHTEMAFKTPEGRDFNTLVKDPGQRTIGHVLWLTNAEVKTLDNWEDQYKRVHMTTEAGRGVSVYTLLRSKELEHDNNG